MGGELERVHLDPRPGDVLVSEADVSLADERLGYEPAVHFGEGLRRTIDWIAATSAAQAAAP
jgi:UDP-glucose 4-epimerase